MDKNCFSLQTMLKLRTFPQGFVQYYLVLTYFGPLGVSIGCYLVESWWVKAGQGWRLGHKFGGRFVGWGGSGWEGSACGCGSWGWQVAGLIGWSVIISLALLGAPFELHGSFHFVGIGQAKMAHFLGHISTDFLLHLGLVKQNIKLSQPHKIILISISNLYQSKVCF